MSIFCTFEHICLSTKITKQIKKPFGMKAMWYSYLFMQLQYILLFNLPKSLTKRTQTTKNSWKWLFFVGLSTFPCWPRLQIKSKSIAHAISCGTFIISCNSNISHSLTCPKTWGKVPKRLKKTPKMIIFYKFEHFSLPTMSKNQNKNH